MARIRTIKPEFWEDDVVGSISREARLLFIASLNLADDEGLLRWTPAFLKASAFIYDDDIGIAEVEKFMGELTKPGLVHSYRAGRAQQSLACIVGFHKHQKINRPTPSKLPPPSIQATATKNMYADRDGWTCHLCNGRIDETKHGCDPDFTISLDHLVPVSLGGSDYPSNIKASHMTCNKGRGDRTVEEYKALLTKGKTLAQFSDLGNEEASEPLTESLNDPLTPGKEGKGREGNGSLRASAPDGFEEWYSGYPRKIGKGQARKAYKAALKKADHETLVAGTARYRAEIDGKDQNLICHPATWLNGERWLDAPGANASAKTEHKPTNGHAAPAGGVSDSEAINDTIRKRRAERLLAGEPNGGAPFKLPESEIHKMIERGYLPQDWGADCDKGRTAIRDVDRKG